MRGRIPLNSESLKKNFPQIYRELFSKCPIVASAPGGFWWCGEHGVLEGNFALIQKIPARVYVGIEPTSPPDVKIGSFLYFSTTDQKFLTNFMEEPVATKLLTFLREQVFGSKSGIILHIISEVPINRGLNASGAFSASLSAAIKLFLNETNTKAISSWRHSQTSKLLLDSNFHKTLLLAWKIESILHGDLTSGSTVIAPMIGGDYPTICFPPHQDLSNLQNHWQTRYSHLDNKKIAAARLNEFFEFKSLPSWSFDFGLIYSGDSRPTSAVHQISIARRNELHQVLTKAKHLNFLKPYVLPKEHSWDSYMQALKINSLEILLNFREVFEKGLSEKVMRDFFLSINRYQDLLNVVTTHSTGIESVENLLRQKVYELGDEFGIGTKTSGGGIKGDVLFVTAYHSIRDTLDNLLEHLSRSLKLDFFLDYASWIDGIEDDNVSVEQDLLSKIYSDFVSAGSYFVKHFSSNGFKHTDIYTPEHFEIEQGSMPLILNPFENEIWIRKTKLDSKTIPSSQTTIKVLKILLENYGKQISNSKLPDSSYSHDRNELQSKIISPINKQVRKHLGKDLPIEIHGTLDKFAIKLSDVPFSIHLIEKIF